MKLICLYVETRLSRQVSGADLAPYVLRHLAKCPRCAHSAQIWMQIANGVDQIRAELPSAPAQGWKPLELPRQAATAPWLSTRQALAAAGVLAAVLLGANRLGPQFTGIIAGSGNTQPPRATVSMFPETMVSVQTPNPAPTASSAATEAVTAHTRTPVAGQVRVSTPPAVIAMTAQARPSKPSSASKRMTPVPVMMKSSPLVLPATAGPDAVADTVSFSPAPAMVAARTVIQPVSTESDGNLARPVLDSAVYEPSRISE